MAGKGGVLAGLDLSLKLTPKQEEARLVAAQERRRQQCPILHDPDGTAFLRDEQPGVAGGRRQVQGKAQARRHRFQTDRDSTFGRTEWRIVAGATGERGNHQQTES